jgi:hypothetical protein
MADIVTNIALGRPVELYNRVDLNDPSTAVFWIALLATTGLEADSVFKDADTFAAMVAGATNECTNTNYARKVLTDSDLTAFSPDDTNDRADLDIADPVFTGIANDGTGAISALVIGYDATTSGVTETAMVPITKHDFVIALPDGSDINGQVATSGFFRAS